MTVPRLRPVTLLVVFVALACPTKTRAQIYADVTVAGAASGTFTITLEYVKTPAAAANFIGLATGRRGWVDRLTGAIRSDGFYNGVTFHRVIAGFMSQTGSRAGDGTDGPGYSFKNEIDATLTHNAAYVVAMANSGKDTNGSQYYITAAAQPSLDGGYTVFGHVTAGQAVCNAINATPTNASDRPLTAITITGITVYGPSYAAFNLAQPLLPKVVDASPLPKKTGAAYALGYEHRAYSEYFGFHSGDFATWTKFASGYYANTAPAAGDLDLTSFATGNRHFFRYGRADYTTCANLFVPTTVAGKSLHFSIPLGGTLAVNGTATGGTWTFDGAGSIGIISYNSFPQPYSGYIYLQLSSGYQFSIDRLEYTSATAGTYVGRTDVPGYSNVSGTFTSTP